MSHEPPDDPNGPEASGSHPHPGKPTDPRAPDARPQEPPPEPTASQPPTGVDAVLRSQAGTPSFFPDTGEDLDAFLDQLIPSLVPGPRPSEPAESGSGLRITGTDVEVDLAGLGDDVSQVVSMAQGQMAIEAAAGFSSSDALAALALDERPRDGELAEPIDEAALATLTSLPRRSPLAPPNPLTAGGQAGQAARADLLQHLSGCTHDRSVRVRLLMSAAETHEERGAFELSRTLHALCVEGSYEDALALREARRDAIHAREFGRAADLLVREAGLAVTAAERGLLLTALAELRARHLQDPEGAMLAARQALEAHPATLTATLLLCELHGTLGDPRAAAEVLRRGAMMVNDPALHSGLLSQAARMLLQAGDPAQAQALFEAASEADPKAHEARVGTYRAARARGDTAAAAHALEALGRLLPAGTARNELARRRGGLLLWVLGDPGAALAELSRSSTSLAQRAAAVAAQRVGDADARREALEGWVREGTQPALALLELALCDEQQARRQSAATLLQEAATADPNLALIRVAQESLARGTGDASSLATAVAQEGERNRLGAAAKLGSAPEHLTHERELLLQARAELDDKDTTDVLLLDVAAEAGDLEAVRRALWGRAERSAPARRVGPLTALLDLHASLTDNEAVREAVRSGLRGASGSLTMLRQAISSVLDVTERAELWRAEASCCDTERAAFALWMAARELTAAGLPGVEHLEAVFTALAGYGPAAWSLERAARAAGSTDALVRLDQALAETEPDPLERRARGIRVALLYAGTDPAQAADLLQRTLVLSPGDPTVLDLLSRLLPPDQQSPMVDHLLESVRDAPASWQRVGRLRAARALELGAQPDAAAVLYRQVLDASDGMDGHALSGLERSLSAGRDPSAWLDWLASRVEGAADARARAQALDALAMAQLNAQQVQAATLSLERCITDAPHEVATLRRLVRIAMATDRRRSLARYAELLAEELDDPSDRAAQLWQALRLRSAFKTTDRADLDALATRLAARGLPDLWSALAEETAVRRAGRPHALADLMARVETLVSDPAERASFALRGAEALEALSAQSAMDALEDAAELSPDHPLIQEEFGRLADAAEHPHRAAQALEAAAQAARGDERKLRLWYRAGVLWQDHLNAPEAAAIALENVASLDVAYRDAFARLRVLHTDSNDRAALCRLLERRLQRGAATPLRAELCTELSRLRLSMGDREGAKHALTEAMQADPERVGTLQGLARLHVADGDHRAAADVLVRLARSTSDPDLLCWAFRELGRIYAGPLSDPRRAKIAFTRVLGLFPEDREAVEQLGQLFEQSGEYDRAYKAWQTLAERSEASPADVEAYRIRMAGVLTMRGEPLQAERLLDALRRDNPLSLRIVEAITAHYAAQGATDSVNVHLDRSVHAFRSAVRESPEVPELWEGLISTLRARRHDAAADACTRVARELCQVTLQAAPGAETGIGSRVQRSHAAHRAMPRQLSVGLRALFAALAGPLDRASPHPLAQRSSDATELRPELRAAAQRAGEWFGLPTPVVHLDGGSGCVPICEQPFQVAIGSRLAAELDEASLTYLLARCAAQTALHLTYLVRATPDAIREALQAVLAHVAPRTDEQPESEETPGQIAQALTALLPMGTPGLAHGAFELDGSGGVDVLGLTHMALEVGARSALLATGDLAAALRAIAVANGVGTEPAELLALIRQDAEADALLYFAVSDFYFDALQEAPE